MIYIKKYCDTVYIYMYVYYVYGCVCKYVYYVYVYICIYYTYTIYIAVHNRMYIQIHHIHPIYHPTFPQIIASRSDLYGGTSILVVFTG